jgi:epoxide hydrolase 4
LADSGYRVVVPDQRGYNLSDKPPAVEDYRMGALTADIIGLVDHFEREKAVIIGHDWGAAVAWQAAIRYPQRVERLGILNVPHPAAHAHALKKPVLRQWLKSWYIYFFQLRGVAEQMMRARNFATMRKMLVNTSREGSFTKEDLFRYTESWSQPGALRGMLNWYRAAARSALRASRGDFIPGARTQVEVPTIILWGERDMALIPELAQWSKDWCSDGHLVRFPEATHWVQHDETERVNARLLDFLKDLRTDSPAS